MRPKAVQSKIDAVYAQIEAYLKKLKETNAFNADYVKFMEEMKEPMTEEEVIALSQRSPMEWTQYQTSRIYWYIKRLKRCPNTKVFIEVLEEYILLPSFEHNEGFVEYGWTRLQKTPTLVG